MTILTGNVIARIDTAYQLREVGSRAGRFGRRCRLLFLSATVVPTASHWLTCNDNSHFSYKQEIFKRQQTQEGILRFWPFDYVAIQFRNRRLQRHVGQPFVEINGGAFRHCELTDLFADSSFDRVFLKYVIVFVFVFVSWLRKTICEYARTNY